MEITSIYKVISLDSSDQNINACISFNKDHMVFEGHFPGNPIVPGVVQIQIIKDLVEKFLGEKVFLNTTKSIKYLNVIRPDELNKVLFEIGVEYGHKNNLLLKCVVKTDTQIYMKYSGNAVIIPHK